MVRISQLLLLEKRMPHLGPSTSQDQTLVLAGLVFTRNRKIIITRSWSLPMSASGKLLVLWMLTPDRKRLLIEMKLIWVWCFPFGLSYVHLLNGSCESRVFVRTRLLKVVNSKGLRSLSFDSTCSRVYKRLPSLLRILPNFPSFCTTRMSFFGV